MQSLVRARQFKDVFTVRQEGDHVQQSIRRKDVIDASNSTRVVFCAGPFARRLNRRRLCLDAHFDDSFWGALIVEETKSRVDFRLYVVRRSARRRWNERTNERTNSLEFFLDEGDRRPPRPRRLVRDPLFFFVVEAKRPKTTKGRGRFFPHFLFFLCGKKKKEKKEKEEETL